MLKMMMTMMGTMMITMMIMVEMKRVLRILVTMMKIRTCLHKESCNVFLSIKFVQFNKIRQQILSYWALFKRHSNVNLFA